MFYTIYDKIWTKFYEIHYIKDKKNTKGKYTYNKSFIKYVLYNLCLKYKLIILYYFIKNFIKSYNIIINNFNSH